MSGVRSTYVVELNDTFFILFVTNEFDRQRMEYSGVVSVNFGMPKMIGKLSNRLRIEFEIFLFNFINFPVSKIQKLLSISYIS